MGNGCFNGSSAKVHPGEEKKKKNTNNKNESKTKVELIKGNENREGNHRKVTKGIDSRNRSIPFKPDEKVISELKKLRRRRQGEEDFSKLPEDERKRKEIIRIFDRFDKWDFDVIGLENLTNGNPLTYCGYVFLLKHDLFKKFSLDEGNYFRFMNKVYELHNNDNHFSNIVRACSVLQSFHFLLRKGLNEFIGEIDIFGAAVACFILYIFHPGLDNHFQAKTEDKITTLYNDMSTTENISCYKFVELVFQKEDEECAFLTKLNKKQRLELREIVIDLVISSDVETHRSVVRQFKMREENNSDFSSKEDVRVLMQIAFKIASMDYVVKPTSQCKEWVKRKAMQQFYQGDVEEKIGYTVNNYEKREVTRGLKFGTTQIKYFDYYYKPLLRAYIDVFGKVKFLSNQLRRNKDFFQIKFIENMEEFESIYIKEDGHVERLLKQQEIITKMFKAIEVPTDQERNISLSEQLKLTPNPTEEDKKLMKECLDILSKRWGVEMKEQRKPYPDVPKIYAVSDFKLYKSVDYEDRLNSVLRHFDRIDEWNFDVFCLEKLFKDDVLFIVSWVLFEKYDFINYFKIPRDLLRKFLLKIQSGYQRNPYHNALHATDVMQITNSICSKGGVIEKLSKVDLLGAIFSSMVHDYEHPGLNDAYQVHSFSYLAQIYNDRSVLEAHHVAETFRLMRNGYDIFKNMSSEDRFDVRKTMVEMIVSTDMCNHAKYVKSFNQLIEEESKFSKKKDIRIALQIVIKMADVSNPSRPTYLYLQWTHCIIREFFKQGDMEKINKLPISPLMDREKSVISKGQMAFMEYVLLPMFKSFSSVFPNFGFTLGGLEKNREYWVNHAEIETSFFDPPQEERKPVSEFVKY